MATTSAKSFLKMLERSGIVADERLAGALNALKKEVRGTVVGLDKLTEHLIDSGLITKWHCDKIKEGKYKGFFLGKFKLLGHLGTGGMSTVYLAEHKLSRQKRAIKVLPRKKVDDKSFLDRFYREARAAAALNHPNIVRVYDINGEDKTHYMVMEFVEGEDLYDMVKANGPLPFDKALDYVRQAAIGLKHAHKRNLVHRDIKPANLLVNENGTLKILDLGLALHDVDDEESLTVLYNEKVMGTADYLSPEQAVNSHQVDHRADIYSLGCTLYYLLTGHPPFPKGTLAQRIAMHQSREPEDIRVSRKDCPAEIVQYCSRMMRKNANERILDCDRIVGAIDRYQESGCFLDPVEKASQAEKEQQIQSGASNETHKSSEANRSASSNTNTGRNSTNRKPGNAKPNQRRERRNRIALVLSFAAAAIFAFVAGTFFAMSWSNSGLTEIARNHAGDSGATDLDTEDSNRLTGSDSIQQFNSSSSQNSNRRNNSSNSPTAFVSGASGRTKPIAAAVDSNRNSTNRTNPSYINVGFEGTGRPYQNVWRVNFDNGLEVIDVGELRTYGNGAIVSSDEGRKSSNGVLIYGRSQRSKQGRRGVEFRPASPLQEIESFSFWASRQRTNGSSKFVVQAKSRKDQEVWQTVFEDQGTLKTGSFTQITITPAMLEKIEARKIRFKLEGEKEDGIYLDDLEIMYKK